MRAAWLALLLGVAATPTDDAVVRAEHHRLTTELHKLASRNAWPGVEAKYADLVALGTEVPTEVHHLAADAARARGDTQTAYRRLLLVIAADGHDPRADAEMQNIRDNFGALTVRRLDATPILLAPYEPPLRPDAIKSIAFAREVLLTTGGFEGLVPVGGYTLGVDHVFRVSAGLAPVLVERKPGDGLDKKAYKKLLRDD